MARKRCEVCAPRGESLCAREHHSGAICTRPRNHEDDHAACGDQTHLVVVWKETKAS